MSSAGWYPDPGGAPGLYRYWTGSAWTAAVTNDPRATAPPTGRPEGSGIGSAGLGGPFPGQTSGGQYPRGPQQPGTGQYPGTSQPASGQYASDAAQRKRGIGWWIAGLAALLAVALIGYFVLGGLVNRGGGIPLPGFPGGTSTPDVCPPSSATTPPTPATTDPDRVSGGSLSFPRLGSPWEEPTYDNRVAFGSLAMMQSALDQNNYDGAGHSWVSSILVSDLYVGDGFASTQTGAETVLKCVLGTYYSDTQVTESRVSGKTHQVDGHDGWLIETQLSFSIPNLKATGERVLLLVVQTDAEEYGLFYASVPDTSPDRLPEARAALADLRVDA